jgi:hypothetical protein
MSQDRKSGAKASQWGRDTAKRIAASIGATAPSGVSNECMYQRHPVVIKSAALKTNSVGVTYRMLDRIDFVVGAFQLADGAFEVRSLPAADFRSAMRPTRSRGAAAGKVGIVRLDAFYEKGQRIGRVQPEGASRSKSEGNVPRQSKAVSIGASFESASPKASDRLLAILGEAKRLAQEYRHLSGKPLGITGEVAEYEAARILGVELTPARQAGFDAIEKVCGVSRRLQIKGRCLLDDSKPGQRLGSIRVDKEWDSVLMVLLDKNFDATEIYEAERKAVEVALAAPGSKARNERGALAVSKFKSIGKLRWRR